MAEAIAALVLRKLADAAVKEIVCFYGAGEKLNSLERELRWIKAFLKDAESKCNSNETVKTWVSEVREASYKIEDVVDTFIAEVNEGNHPYKVSILKQNLNYLIKLPAVYKLTSEMDKITNTLLEIKECADKYGINRELNDNRRGVVPIRRLVKKIILSDEDDLDITGLQEDKDNIVKLLLDLNNKRRCVVSIVGQGGLGKTTLAGKVYNSDEIKKEFEYRMWLSVSQQYRLQDLLKTLLENIRPLTEDEKTLLRNDDQHSQQMVEKHFLAELKVFLKQKRYLVIMDDVWTEHLWVQMENALPNVKNGSRVLMTTRSSDIAQKADPNCDLYNLKYLGEEESQELLLKKVFPDQDLKTFPQNLSEISKKFVEKCHGLPLALLVVGGLLSRQPVTYNSWYRVFEKLSWHDGEGKKCTDILATSYEDLPLRLKSCFMYFGLFPEDHEIKAKSLIRMWVAEGFITGEDKSTMEETAEKYLEELIQRSMIQVSQRYHNGSIKYCRIHDLLRDIAILKGRENRFLEIIPRQYGNFSSTTVRRTALHCNHNDIMEITGPNLHSLLLFGTNNVSNVERFKLLKILDAQKYWKQECIKGDTFKKLIQLRYMSIPRILDIDPCSRFQWWSSRQFWKSLSRMRNLQTLHIPTIGGRNSLSDIHDCIWDIKTLRHVILPSRYYGPPSTAHLPNLQTLKVVSVRVEWLSKGWPTMSNIRVLKLRGFPFNYGESFKSFLSGLHHLTSLHVGQDYDFHVNYEVLDMSAFPCYNHLQSLVARGAWNDPSVPRTITTSSFPVHLIKLKLMHSRLQEDPMPVLERLESLQVLYLVESAYVGRQFNCSARGFPSLQFLSLNRLRNLEEWKADVADGAMPMLKEIKIEWCGQLRLIPGLHYMTSLVKFTSAFGSAFLSQSLREDESHKIRDGQFVHFNIRNIMF